MKQVLSILRKKFNDLFFPPGPYGMLHLLREMLAFPRFLPLPTYPQHGMYVDDKCIQSDLQEVKTYGSICLFNEAMKKDWKNKSQFRCLVTGPILIRYRHFKKWSQKCDARGTIFFPSHSIEEMQVNYSFDDIKRRLENLPTEYHPITVCLHWHDYSVLNLKQVYEEMGFKTVSAGPVTSSDFANNFYDIITSHKYACSNSIGTYVLYALDLNIPFFLIGDVPQAKVTATSLDYLEMGDISFISVPREEYVYSIFRTGPVKEINEEQLSWFKDEAGVEVAMDLSELRSTMINLSLKHLYIIRMIFKVTMGVIQRKIVKLLTKK